MYNLLGSCANAQSPVLEYLCLRLVASWQIAVVPTHIGLVSLQNSAGTANPVWEAYQQSGGPTSPGMTLDFRLKLLLILVVGNLTCLFWELFVILGPVRRFLIKRYPPPSTSDGLYV